MTDANMQHMMGGIQEMAACYEKISQADLDSLQQRSEKAAEEIRQLCQAGKRIGTQDWEFVFGFGALKGLSWGNLTGRVSVQWDGDERKIEPGEYAVEYLKKVSPSWSFVAAVEGEDDEVSFIGETQHAIADNATLKLNLGVGITDKATDIAPEVGVLLRF